MTIDNPVAQKLFITGETYSPRNYPRDSKCQQTRPSTVLYFEHPDGTPVEATQPYVFISWYGFANVGKLEGDLPAGKYKLWIINQAVSRTKNDFTFSVYASKKSPKIK